MRNSETITGLSMQTTLNGQKRNSNMQEMGETREPMARDCWEDAQKLAENYAGVFKRDFWIMYAAKPHVGQPNTIVAGWEVVAKRPPKPIVGVLVFRWSHADKNLSVEERLSLPYDVPLSEDELSKDPTDFVPSLEGAAKASGSILVS